jgi:hypothetical protein
MTKKVFAALLALVLASPAVFGSDQTRAQSVTVTVPAASTALASSQRLARSQSPQAAPQANSRHPLYNRNPRSRLSGISKKEKIFLAAIVGTSLAIGAIAGGGEGLAIGALVGGWAAYAAHRFWGHF